MKGWQTLYADEGMRPLTFDMQCSTTILHFETHSLQWASNSHKLQFGILHWTLKLCECLHMEYLILWDFQI